MTQTARMRRRATALLLGGVLALGAAACEDTPLEDDIDQDIQEGVEDVGSEVEEAGSELEDLGDDDTEG